VTPGSVYRFRVSAKNQYGVGPTSGEVSIYAADKPEPPGAPTTTQQGTYIRIDWDAPDNNGLTIDEYEILIYHVVNGQATWTATSACDGSQSAIVTNTYCDVPYMTLRQTPYSMVLNDVITAKVRSHNLLGWSLAYSSPTTAGGQVKTEPLQPPTAPTEGSATDDNQIQVEWAALTGDYTGQDDILFYEVQWDAGSNGQNWALTVMESAPSFTFTHIRQNGISPGGSYQFKYRASNQHGNGVFSPIATIIASAVPLPTPPATTTNNGLNVDVTWPQVQSTRGAAVEEYRILFIKKDGGTAEIEPACDGNLQTVKDSRACSVPMATLVASPFNLVIGDLIAV